MDEPNRVSRKWTNGYSVDVVRFVYIIGGRKRERNTFRVCNWIDNRTKSIYKNDTKKKKKPITYGKHMRIHKIEFIFVLCQWLNYISFNVSCIYLWINDDILNELINYEIYNSVVRFFCFFCYAAATAFFMAHWKLAIEKFERWWRRRPFPFSIHRCMNWVFLFLGGERY